MTVTTEPLIAEPLWIRARAMYARAVAAIGAPAAIAAITLLGKVLRRDIIAWLCPLEHVVRKLLLAEAAELHRAELARIARAPRIERIPLRGMAMHWQAHRTPSPRGEGAGGGVNLARASTSQTSMRRAHSLRSSLHPTPQSPPLAGRGSADPSHPETWRVSFSFALPRNPHLVPNSRAPRIRNPWTEYTPPPPPPVRAPRAFNHEESPFRLARRFEALRRVLDNPRPHAERLARMLAREVRRFRQVVQRYVMAPCRSNDYDRNDPRLGIDAMGAAFNAPQAFPPDSS